MSDTKKFPAIGLLVVFGVGSAAATVSLAGFGCLMVKQGLTHRFSYSRSCATSASLFCQTFTAPLSTEEPSPTINAR